jgi:cell division protein FtsB
LGLKVVLALRDDIKSLFEALLKHLELKKKLLNSLIEKEKDISYLIKYNSNIEDNIKKLIEDEDHLIDEINVEDYNISQIRDEITHKSGFDFNKIFHKGYRDPENEIIDYKKEIMLHEKMINDLIKFKKENNDQLEKYADDLKVQIHELNSIERLKYVIKDLQSS